MLDRTVLGGRAHVLQDGVGVFQADTPAGGAEPMVEGVGRGNVAISTHGNKISKLFGTTAVVCEVVEFEGSSGTADSTVPIGRIRKESLMKIFPVLGL